VGRRSRIIGYGASLVLVLAGVLVAVLRSDTLAEASAVGLVSFGLIGAMSLVFYEIGLSEDRARARESAARRRRAEPVDPPAPRDGQAEPRRRLVRPRRIRGSR
jgi:hypothetical protein